MVLFESDGGEVYCILLNKDPFTLFVGEAINQA
jgi:hypothetical protein